MAKVLAALSRLGSKPIENLTPEEARKQSTAADAVKQVIKDERLNVDPHQGLTVSNSHFADLGSLRLRYYTPERANKDSNSPVIVYYRGGGWVIGDLDTYDDIGRGDRTQGQRYRGVGGLSDGPGTQVSGGA